MSREEFIALAQAEQSRRKARGLCDEIVDFEPRMIDDGTGGEFMRVTFTFRDNSRFSINVEDPVALTRLVPVVRAMMN